jgi:pyruvate kinase
MNRKKKASPTSPWDDDICKKAIDKLWSLRESMLEYEKILAPWLQQVHPSYRKSARNLIHYLAMRRNDLRELQGELARMGLSSLGRAESHVLASVDKVLGILHKLSDHPWQSMAPSEPVGSESSRRLLVQHTEETLGAAPKGRTVRIMVTLPSEAALDLGLVRQLVASGMDIARINCAHDSSAEWKRMAANVRRAAKTLGRSVRILADLAGPKLRTGYIASEATVLKLRPQRDAFGHMVAPALVGLRPAGSGQPVRSAAANIGVDPSWLATLMDGDEIEFTDARGSKRLLLVTQRDEIGALAECKRTAYLVQDTLLTQKRKKRGADTTPLFDLPELSGALHLRRGDILRLTRRVPAQSVTSSNRRMARVACTLPEVFGDIAKGERIWFDDGRIGGVIRRIGKDSVDVEITQARESGEKLAGDKGINLPDSQLNLPALTAKDIEDLAIITDIADLVGLSFVQKSSDIDALRARLLELGRPDLGIILKIETRRSFENLPELLFSAMAGNAAGIMIARGDLAVECGYERLAEVQEEILWAAEAAHMPVIWATQVLEALAKTGLPSRAEITDAAMGERAECVMLNKGPYIVDAISMLDDILRRMEAHQSKKRPLLRALKSWDIAANSRH